MISRHRDACNVCLAIFRGAKVSHILKLFSTPSLTELLFTKYFYKVTAVQYTYTFRKYVDIMRKIAVYDFYLYHSYVTVTCSLVTYNIILFNASLLVKCYHVICSGSSHWLPVSRILYTPVYTSCLIYINIRCTWQNKNYGLSSSWAN